MRPPRILLYVVSALTDFAGFVVVFVVSRTLAEGGASPVVLGLVGASFAVCQSLGSISGGLLTQRCDGRAVFCGGAAALALSSAASVIAPTSLAWMLPWYWLLGLGVGLLYPPLIGWLNDAAVRSDAGSGVSRTLLLFCVAWNVGMLCGQLSAGRLFGLGPRWPLAVAAVVAAVNLLLACGLSLQMRSHTAPHAAETDAAPLSAEDRRRARLFQRLSWLANLGGMFGGSLVVHLLPDLAVRIGVPAAQHGQLLAAWRVVIISMYVLLYLTPVWQFRLGPALGVQALGAAGLLVIGQADAPLELFVGLALLGQLVGYNYFAGLFYSSAGETHERRAFAAGLHEATLAAGMALGTIGGGLLGAMNHRLPYTVAAGVALVLLTLQGVVYTGTTRGS